MNHDVSAQVDVPTADDASRVASIRSRLPGQVLRQRIDMAKVCYGPLYTPAEMRRKVGEALPYRFGFIRGAALEPILKAPVGSWLQARRGRTARLRIGEIEADVRTAEDLARVIKIATCYQNVTENES